MCGAVIGMSSAYVISCTESGGSGMLKSMGERTSPCGTPDLNCRFVDVWFLNVVYAMRPLMSFAMYMSMVCGMFDSVSLSINVCMFVKH